MSWWLSLVPIALDLLGKAMGGGQSRHDWVDPGHHARVQKQLDDAKSDAEKRAKEVERFQNEMKKQTENVQKMAKLQEEQKRAIAEQVKQRAEETARLTAKMDEQRKNEEAERKRVIAEQSKQRAEETARLMAKMDEQRRQAEEERKKVIAEQGKQRAEDTARLMAKMDEQRKQEEAERKRVIAEHSKQRAEETARLMAKMDEQRKKEEEERKRLIAEQSKQREEETARFMAKMDEQRRQVEAERKLREESIAKAEAALRDAQRKEEDLMATLQMFSQGFSPILWPTQEEIDRANLRLGPDRDDYYHIAVAGYTGTGKSSIINAFRGVKNNNKDYAANVGVTETTIGIGRYPDPSQSGPRAKFVWYDIPGSGTLLKPGPQYFNDHGLFVFDIILVLFGGRFTQQDLAILEHAARFKVPTFLIRSKSNQYIENIIREELDYEGVQFGPEFEGVYQRARELYERETKQSVQKNLGIGEYHDPNQKVYLVSAPGMRAYVNNISEGGLQPTSRWIDEAQLIENIVTSIVRRRFNPEKPDDGNDEVEAKIRDAMNLAKGLFGQKKRSV